MSQTSSDTVNALLDARAGGPALPHWPGAEPDSVAAAHAIQDAIMAREGVSGGWKVMAGGPAGEPMCSPIPQRRYFADGARIDAGIARLFLAEVEVAVKLGADFPARDGGYTTGDIEAGIASLHPALEFIANPFVDRGAIAALALLGDLQSNGSVVVGPASTDWQGMSFETLDVTLALGGETVKSAAKGASWTQILEALAWLAGHAAGRGMPLKAGDVIITGSRVLDNLGDATSVAGTAGALGTVTAELVGNQ